MPNPIDPLTGPKYILEGRVVTMGPAGAIDDGAIYIEKGQVMAVQPAGDTVPAGFDDAPGVRTGDTIYPGLIELHNHLSYNAMPLWDVPKKFTNNNQWKNHADYRRLITKPSQVLGRTAGVVEACVRYVECRSMLGGTTTSQGITLASAGAIKSYYKGIVRNVEQTDEDALPRAGTKIANPDNGGAAQYLERLNRNTCYLQHLSEGIDDTVRGWFHRLRISDTDWAVNEKFCGIHSTALGPDDLGIIAARNGSIVWSPVSNYLLYGGTLDLQAAKDSGILMGIGCDWAPSGSKNLLGELKVAWLASQEAGDVFSPEELVKMATINPARILKWEAQLGSIEVGKRADLIAINGRTGDVYEHLLEARETALTLVVINGVPRVGQKRLMKPFGGGPEEITIGSSKRILNLVQETSHPLLRDLTLTEATARLADAMNRLPELAVDLDNATAGGVFSGSTDAENTTWQVAFEFDDEEPLFTGAALPYADYVQRMALDPITVTDDSDFLRNMVAARNLPEFVKEGLPPLYGESIPIPDSAGFVQNLPLLAETRDLKTFLRTSGELSAEDRLRIVRQALVLLDENYVHLPLKRAMHAVDPAQRLRLLRHQLENGETLEEIDFHKELTRIFTSLRDLHTLYHLPRPYRGKVAWLPYLIEEYWQGGDRKYMVTKVVGDAGPDTLKPGVEVSHWNGMPIHRAVMQNAERQAGSNEAARLARGINSLTIRPLTRGLPPDEEWVELRYKDADGEVHEWRQEWLLFSPGQGGTDLNPEALALSATAIGLDAHTDDIQQAKRIMYAGDVVLEEASAPAGTPIANTADGPATILPTVFRAKPVMDGKLGYIRIFTFSVNDPQVFVDEFVRLVKELPQEGLIIDVRGNGGGHIHAAERLLQVLTPREIEPERAQFITSRLNLQLCRAHAPSDRFEGLDLSDWIESIQESVRTGATYSLGFPITPREDCNDIGQKYQGPALLITDALCYSATDMFAASFADHRIGPILGVHANTGAGGANVWSYNLLRKLLGDDVYSPLPHGADMRVAIRRTTRVGENAGGVVEDLGVPPTAVYRMTEADVRGSNEGLIEKAAEMLESETIYGLGVRREGARLHLATKNVSYVEVAINDRTLAAVDVENDAAEVDLEQLGASAPFKLDLRAFDEDQQLVAAHRRSIE